MATENNILDQIRETMNAPAPQRWEDVFIDYSQAIPPEPPALAWIGGIGIVFRAGLTSISGPDKAGKSTFVRLMLASLLAEENIIGVTTAPGASVILFDTEQPADRILRQIDGAFRLAHRRRGIVPNIQVAQLRQHAPDERFKIVTEAIEDRRPDIAIIDGVTDLANDPNDLVESGRIVADLLALAEQQECAVVVLIHTNPGAPDGKMRGHIGSELMRKCESNILLQKTESNTFEASCKSSRGRPFDKIRFAKDEHDDIIAVDAPEKPIATKDRIHARMQPGKAYTYSALLNILDDGTPEGTIKGAIRDLLRKGLIIGDRHNGYSLSE